MSFDYIIIGAGSAGCVLANRLTESQQNSVCVLEAGSDNNSFLVNTPGAFAAFMFLKKYNWSFNAEVKSDIRKGEAMFIPRGRGLGGSSATNAMLYIRGQAEDYNHWAALGNEGWSFADMLPYFKKSEHNEDLSEYNNFVGGVMDKFENMMNPESMSSATQIAEVIFTAATDGSNTLRYRAGEDAEQLLSARKTMEDSDFIQMMKSNLNIK